MSGPGRAEQALHWGGLLHDLCTPQPLPLGSLFHLLPALSAS